MVLDCSGAGVLIPYFTAALNDATGGGAGPYHRSSSATMDNSERSDVSGAEYLKAIRDTMVPCLTAQGEWLPLNPEFPADIFTSCLTTPIPMAIRWFVYQRRSVGTEFPTLAGRRNATGLNLSSYSSRDQGSPDKGMPRSGSAGANGFTIGTPPSTLAPGNSSPRKGYNQTFPQINEAPAAEECLYPESKFYSWQKVAFGVKENKTLDPLSDKGAIKRYRKTRNSLVRKKANY